MAFYFKINYSTTEGWISTGDHTETNGKAYRLKPSYTESKEYKLLLEKAVEAIKKEFFPPIKVDNA